MILSIFLFSSSTFAQSSSLSSTVSATSTISTDASSATSIPSVSYANVSAGCAAALQAANSSAANACPDMAVVTSLVTSPTVGGVIYMQAYTNYVQTICGNAACAQQLNSLISALTTGACAQDSITVVENGTTTTVPLSMVGWYSAIGDAVLCTKTSDNKYCALGQIENLAPIIASSSLSTSASLSSLYRNTSAICDGCVKNELANAVAVPNLPSSFKVQFQRFLDQEASFCGGNTYTTAGSVLHSSAVINSVGSVAIAALSAALLFA